MIILLEFNLADVEKIVFGINDHGKIICIDKS